MSFLVDTNTISELIKPSPSSKVRRWMDEHSEQLSLSWVSVAEMRAGVEVLPPGEKRDKLRQAVEALILDYYQESELALNQTTAENFASLQRDRKKAGNLKSWPDTVLAAVAREHGLTVVTRNTKDFPGVTTFNPWD